AGATGGGTAMFARGVLALATIAARPAPARATPARAPAAGTTPAGGAAAGTTGRLAAATGLAQVLDLLRGQARAGALGPGQPPGGVLGDIQIAVHVRGGRVGLRRFADAQVQRPVDEQPAGHVVPVHEGDRGAGVARPPGAADAVHVGLLVLRALVVHHVRDVVHVDTPSGDVSGHQHVHLAVPEGPQGLLPGALAEVAVQ